MPTAYISYGFCEGPHIGYRLAQSIRQAGFELVDDPTRTDIFIGHSAGCLLVPATIKNTRLIVLIGLPYWPGKSVLRALLEKNAQERAEYREQGAAWEWRRKFYWNSMYFWRMTRNWYMLRNLHKLELPKGVPILCIRNRQDACCTENVWQQSHLKNAAFVSLPGNHDDLWLHPQLYTAIIKAQYGTNILASTTSQ